MKKIGLTGGIGTGKTYVAKIFQKFGIPVFCADTNAKELLQTNTKLINQVRKEFGSNIYLEGVLQSKELADIVFREKSMLVITFQKGWPFWTYNSYCFPMSERVFSFYFLFLNTILLSLFLHCDELKGIHIVFSFL